MEGKTATHRYRRLTLEKAMDLEWLITKAQLGFPEIARDTTPNVANALRRRIAAIFQSKEPPDTRVRKTGDVRTVWREKSVQG